MIILLSFLGGCSLNKVKLAKGSDQLIRYNLSLEPKSIDPAFSTGVEENIVVANAFEGLLRLDENQNPVPGVAEKYEVSKDGLKYTFHLRKNALWWDGRKVTAEDFNYAWKRVLNPDTASGFASKLYCIKNGEAYNNRKTTTENLGIRVIDSRTLEITLEKVVEYFPSLVASPICSPLRKDVVDKSIDGWTTKSETYVCNGPFKMEQWTKMDSINFVKNDKYWNEKNIKLNRLEYKLIGDSKEYFSAFNAGKLDFIQKPPTSEIPNLIKSGSAKIYPYLSVNCIMVNFSDNAVKLDGKAAIALKDVKVRWALALAINRKDIAADFTSSVKKLATAFVPKGINQDKLGTDFGKKDYFKPEGDVAQAKKLLAEAGYPEGKGFPTITYNYETDEDSKNIAETIKDMWKKNLGINIKLKSVEKKVFTKNIVSKGYVLSNSTYFGDYTDPMTFLDMLTSVHKNNYVSYNNSNFDGKMDAANKEVDGAKRMKLLHEGEDILMTDMPIIPVYFGANLVCGKDYVKGVKVTSLGIVLFDKAYVTLKQ
jgi:oligopeptide transport system substrate-binding protein